LKEGTPTKRRRNHEEEFQQKELEDGQALNNVAQKPFEEWIPDMKRGGWKKRPRNERGFLVVMGRLEDDQALKT
jgi:hypothetical protein